MQRPIVTPERFMDMPFPIFGTDLLLGPSMQRPLTTATGVNVRAYENLTLRGRGGSRPGLGKFVPSQIPAGSTLIQHLNLIVDPDATALLNTISSGNGSGQPPPLLGPTAVLDTSSPDENGDRTNGDEWVPLGGWGVQPIRTGAQPQTLVAYMVDITLNVDANYTQGGNQGTITATGSVTCKLNGNTIGSLNGTTTWPADQNGSPNVYSADINANTDSRLPAIINHPPQGGNLQGPHHSTSSIALSAFVFGNPPGTGINTLAITGTWSVQAPNPSVLVPGFNWVRAAASVRQFRSPDKGNTWIPSSGNILAPVSGVSTNLGLSSGPLVDEFPGPTLSTTFTL